MQDALDEPRTHVPLRRHRLDAAPVHRHEAELRRDEHAVGEEQNQNDQQTESGTDVVTVVTCSANQVRVSPAQAGAATAAMALGALVQGGVGFGSALVAAPLLALVDTNFVPGPITVVTTVLNLFVIRAADAAAFDRQVRWSLGGLVPGTIAAGATLLALSARGLSLAFAVMVILGVVITGVGLHVVKRPSTLFGAGVLSGFMGTVSGIGGPPVALLYQHDSGRTLRATLPRYFLVGGSITMVTLVAVGKLGGEELLLALVLVPGMLVGLAGSSWLAGHVDRRTARPFVLLLSTLAAVSVLIKELL